MGFKINQAVVDEPKYCDYIQEKIDVAKEHNATYELVDEDIRIQALYDNENLITKDVIKQINRVRVNGKEYITINKNVDFFTRDEKDANEPGAYFDRYSTVEGIVEIPVRTSATAASDAATPTRIVYTIPFNKDNLNKYARNNDGIVYRFYEGTTSSNRLPSSVPSVTNLEFFSEATWDELLLGREKRVLNSMMNRLPEIRKEFNKQENKIEPKEEVNKKEEVKEIVEQQGQTGRETEPQIEPLNNKQSTVNKGGNTGTNKRA